MIWIDLRTAPESWRPGEADNFTSLASASLEPGLGPCGVASCTSQFEDLYRQSYTKRDNNKDRPANCKAEHISKREISPVSRLNITRKTIEKTIMSRKRSPFWLLSSVDQHWTDFQELVSWVTSTFGRALKTRFAENTEFYSCILCLGAVWHIQSAPFHNHNVVTRSPVCFQQPSHT